MSPMVSDPIWGLWVLWVLLLGKRHTEACWAPSHHPGTLTTELGCAVGCGGRLEGAASWGEQCHRGGGAHGEGHLGKREQLTTTSTSVSEKHADRKTARLHHGIMTWHLWVCTPACCSWRNSKAAAHNFSTAGAHCSTAGAGSVFERYLPKPDKTFTAQDSSGTALVAQRHDNAPCPSNHKALGTCACIRLLIGCMTAPWCNRDNSSSPRQQHLQKLPHTTPVHTNQGTICC